MQQGNAVWQLGKRELRTSLSDVSLSFAQITVKISITLSVLWSIRRSVEQRESTEQESAEFMRKHRRTSWAMKKTVAVRAKVMDPHSSLKEVYHEKLKQDRESDQQRIKEYAKELHDMKTRVTDRPHRKTPRLTQSDYAEGSWFE
uniref:Uncharacterized protein n=2 Tax=Hucho hucho TaxID=62062 RepID=A0A4W5KGZ4_9TELE